jgi:hypothetical protein
MTVSIEKDSLYKGANPVPGTYSAPVTYLK